MSNRRSIRDIAPVGRKKKNKNKDNLYLLKWLSLISGCLILGGILSFGLILICMRIIDGSLSFSPIWIVGMIPLMVLVALPVTFLIYKQLVKHLNPLLSGMEKVAGGDLETYIPTAEAKDFAKVYNNFNKMVAEIQSVESLRTTMLDNLSHELKTPLASINGFSKLLIERELPHDKQRRYLEIIAAESDKLDKLIKNTLLLSKLDAQEIVSRKEEYSLKQQLEDCIIALEHEWSVKNLNLGADLADVKLLGDVELAKWIWHNLLSNAIKFTPQNGDINVTLTEDAECIRVIIADSGIGMSEEVLQHIFQRHYQADTTQKSSGQGLGLAIVKRAVMLCGGKITVSSKENEGSSFVVEFPKSIN